MDLVYVQQDTETQEASNMKGIVVRNNNGKIISYKKVKSNYVCSVNEEFIQPGNDELERFIEGTGEYHNYVVARQDAYPHIGDQLDAILKQLNYMQMKGKTNLIRELDGVVAQWLKVKRDHPKPGDK